MARRPVLRCMVLLGAVLATGCTGPGADGPGVDGPGVDGPETSSFTSSVAPPPDGGRAVGPATALPSSGYPDLEAYLQALFEGELEATDDGCLYARAGNGTGTIAVGLRWPQGWTARPLADGEYEVLDLEGNRRLRTGDVFSVAGGPDFATADDACGLNPPDTAAAFAMHDEPRRVTTPADR